MPPARSDHAAGASQLFADTETHVDATRFGGRGAEAAQHADSVVAVAGDRVEVSELVRPLGDRVASGREELRGQCRGAT